MITIVFGNIGAGKTTYGARLVYQNEQKKKIISAIPFLKRFIKPYDRIYCNEPTMSNTIYFPVSDIGKYKLPVNSLFIIDEAGIELSNRNWKTLPWFSKNEVALSRHRGHDYVLLSQSIDIDIAWRQRTHDIILLTKFAGRTRCEHIRYKIDVDNQTHEVIEYYSKSEGFLNRLVARITGKIYSFSRRKYYKYFNSYVDNYPYPEKDTPSKYLS